MRGMRAVTAALADGDPDAQPESMLAGETSLDRWAEPADPSGECALRHGGRESGTPRVDGAALVEVLTAALAAVRTLAPRSRATRRWSTRSAGARDAAGAARRRRPAGTPRSAAAAVRLTRARARTTPMQARKGRASYLGERSVGHRESSATSTGLIVGALGSALCRPGLTTRRRARPGGGLMVGDSGKNLRSVLEMP